MERTVCACDKCIAPCKKQPGYMILEDVFALTEFLKTEGRITEDSEVNQYLCASPGPIVGKPSTGQMWRIPTITPKFTRGRCVFLDEKDRCTIHSVSPVGCRMFDVHMVNSEAERRSQYFIRMIARDQVYQRLRSTLEPRTS